VGLSARWGGAEVDQREALAVDPLGSLNTHKKQQLNELFALNRRVMKTYLLKESLDRLWNYSYEGAMSRYLQSWTDQLRWQRLKPMEKLAQEGILNYCKTKVPLGVVEAMETSKHCCAVVAATAISVNFC